METPERERLDEAIQAMRNDTGITAAEWARRYPTFHADRHRHLRAGLSRIQAMQYELQLRIAEFLVSRNI